MLRIVIASDGSPSARAALQRAGELFPGAQATVLTVAQGVGALADRSSAARLALPDDVIRTAVTRMRETALADAEELTRAACQDATEAGLRAEPKIGTAHGAIWKAILEESQEADVIVCGTRGHGAAVRAVVGSVASGLVHHSQRPVLVVPETAPSASGPVLIAFDSSDAATGAVQTAGALFRDRDVVVAHVWRSELRHTLTGAAVRHAPLREIRDVSADLDAALEQAARETADAGLALAREHGLQGRSTAIESGESVAQAIMRAADEADAGVSVVGRRGRGVVAGAVLGSVSLSLVHGSGRPVLVAQS